ncbi:hypothetical protein GCM10028786_10130 [Flaviaesturariibacter terrae]
MVLMVLTVFSGEVGKEKFVIRHGARSEAIPSKFTPAAPGGISASLQGLASLNVVRLAITVL